MQACMLVCWDFINTLEIIARTLREVVNRERLCDTNAFYFGHFRNLWGCQTPCRSKKEDFKHIEFQAQLLDYFLSNKSNINQLPTQLNFVWVVGF